MADVRKVEFDVGLEKSDYRSVVYYNVMGKNKFAMFGMGFVLLACIAYLLADLAGLMEVSGLIRFVCAAFIILDAVLFAFMESITGKLMTSDRQYLGKKRHVTVNEDGITSKNAKEEEPLHFPWQELYNAAETKKQFLMFSRTGMILILPKSALTREQVPQLRKILKVMMQGEFKTKG